MTTLFISVILSIYAFSSIFSSSLIYFLIMYIFSRNTSTRDAYNLSKQFNIEKIEVNSSLIIIKKVLDFIESLKVEISLLKGVPFSSFPILFSWFVLIIQTILSIEFGSAFIAVIRVVSICFTAFSTD